MKLFVFVRFWINEKVLCWWTSVNGWTTSLWVRLSVRLSVGWSVGREIKGLSQWLNFLSIYHILRKIYYIETIILSLIWENRDVISIFVIYILLFWGKILRRRPSWLSTVQCLCKIWFLRHIYIYLPQNILICCSNCKIIHPSNNKLCVLKLNWENEQL